MRVMIALSAFICGGIFTAGLTLSGALGFGLCVSGIVVGVALNIMNDML